jgi:hypothetical protein
MEVQSPMSNVQSHAAGSAGILPASSVDSGVPLKPCSICKRDLQLSEFYKEKKQKSGCNSACKRCYLDRLKVRRAYKAAGMINCPICSQFLPLAAFGICRARKNGHNLYCKDCVNKKVTDSRRYQREYRTMRYAARLAADLAAVASMAENPETAPEEFGLKDRRVPLTLRILKAIGLGHHTYNNIETAVRHKGRESKDQFGDAITTLLLHTREVRYEGTGDSRRYFLREVEVVRKADVMSPRARTSAAVGESTTARAWRAA